MAEDIPEQSPPVPAAEQDAPAFSLSDSESRRRKIEAVARAELTPSLLKAFENRIDPGTADWKASSGYASPKVARSMFSLASKAIRQALWDEDGEARELVFDPVFGMKHNRFKPEGGEVVVRIKERVSAPVVLVPAEIPELIAQTVAAAPGIIVPDEIPEQVEQAVAVPSPPSETQAEKDLRTIERIAESNPRAPLRRVFRLALVERRADWREESGFPDAVTAENALSEAVLRVLKKLARGRSDLLNHEMFLGAKGAAPAETAPEPLQAAFDDAAKDEDAAPLAGSFSEAHGKKTKKLSHAAQHRNAYAAKFFPYIEKVARRLARRLPAHVEIDDLISSGVTGLLEAAERFDPHRVDRFEAFAEFRIRGAMLDDLRSRDTLSRDMRRLSNELRDTTRRLEATLGRTPEHAEVAKSLGLDINELYARQKKLSGSSVVGIDDAGPDLLERTGDQSGVDPFDQAALKEIKERTFKAIGDLPEKQQQVLSLYYKDNLNLKEIGTVLNVTESRACQIHGEATRNLREALKIYEADEKPAPRPAAALRRG